MEEEMPKVKYLSYRKQRKTYFTRYPVPPELHSLIGKKYLTAKIESNNAKEVERQHIKNREAMERLIAEAEAVSKLDGNVSTFKERFAQRQAVRRSSSVEARLAKLPVVGFVPDSRLGEMLEEWFEMWFDERKHTLLYFIDLEDKEQNLNASTGAPEGFRQDIADMLGDLHKSDEGHGTLPHIDIAKRICLDNGTNLDASGRCFRKLSRIVWDIVEETCRWQLACMDKGEHTSFYPLALEKFHDRIRITLPSRVAGETVRPSCMISELFAHYRNSQRDNKGVSESTLAEYDTPMKLMIELLGDVPIGSLGYEDFERVKEQFNLLPKRTRKEYRGKSFQECIKIADEKNHDRLNTITLNRYLATIRGAFLFAEETHLIEKCPIGKYRFTGSSRKVKGAASVKRVPFETDVLNAIFFAPCYSGCSRKTWQNAAGEFIVHNARYWMPLIAFYTGARLGEIAQLLCSQIERIDGVDCFRIKTEVEGQRLKTNSSRRIVPIHSELKKIGILEYKKTVSDFSKKLLPSLGPTKTASVGRSVGKWFSRTLLRSTLGIDKEGLTFHSFRHTFATIAYKAGIDLALIDALCGWSSDELKYYRKAMRDTYIHKEELSASALQEVMEKVCVKELDLSHLYLSNLKPTDDPFVFIR